MIVDIPRHIRCRLRLLKRAVHQQLVPYPVTLLGPRDDGSLGRPHHHQQVPILGVGGEHGGLPTDLTPVPASGCGGDGEKSDLGCRGPRDLDRESMGSGSHAPQQRISLQSLGAQTNKEIFET